MPAKYHIPIRAVPARFRSWGKSTVLDWGEGCLRCTRCVKETCPYGAFEQRSFDSRSLADTIDALCKNCFRCVQGCPRELVAKVPCPQYEELGDDYWTPEIILTTWYQAESGRIPVSGAGYAGPFTGPGFDSIWTDMSEIVRPTRDGIHGREYISTAIDLGRKPLFLVFNDQGELALTPPSVLELPLPVILGAPPLGAGPAPVHLALAQAGQKLSTLALMPRSQIGPDMESLAGHLLPHYPEDHLDLDDPLLARVRAVELADHPDILPRWEALKRRFPELITCIKVPADGQAAERVAALAAAGAEVIHLAAGEEAQGLGEAQDLHLKDLIRQCHLRLVGDQVRDTVTLLTSGGIALAEHVAKAVICGADGVIPDLALLVALECRVCRRCQEGQPCPVDMSRVPLRWAAQRLVNLMGAWNNQLLEVLGAMGLREVRRLRGEVGRAMFVEDLDREIMAPIFAPLEKPALKRDAN